MLIVIVFLFYAAVQIESIVPPTPFVLSKPYQGTQAEIIVQPGGNLQQLAYFWKLVIFLDLKPYLDKVIQIENMVSNVEALCTHNDSTIQEVCGTYMNEISFATSQISQLNQLFASTNNNPQTKRKRSPLDGIGAVAKMITGIMDATDRKLITSEINNLIQTQESEKHLLLETTSLVKSSIDLFNNSFNSVKENEEHLASGLNDLQNQIIQSRSALSDIDYRIKINTNRIATYEILSRLVLVMNNFINEQKDLFQVMVNLNHIPNLPVIVKPETLLQRLTEIGSLLPSDVALPVTPTLNHIYWYYQQTLVNTLLTDNTLMIQLNVPIIDLSELSVFHLFSLPIQVVDSNFDIIKLESELVATDNQQNNYMLLTKVQLSKCLSLPNHNKLCPAQQTFNYQQHPICEVQWIRRVANDSLIPTLCQIERVSIPQVTIIETSLPNVWLYALPKESVATFINPRGLQFQETINGSGQIVLLPGTTAIIEGITIKAHPMAGSSVQEKWTSTLSVKSSNHIVLPDSPKDQSKPLKIMPKLIPLWGSDKAGKIDEKASEIHSQISNVKIQRINKTFSVHIILLYITFSIILIGCSWVALPPYYRTFIRLWNHFRPGNVSPATVQTGPENIHIRMEELYAETVPENVELPASSTTPIDIPNFDPIPRARYF